MKFNKDGYLIQKASDRSEFVNMLKQDDLRFRKILILRKHTPENLGIYIAIR